MKDTILREIQRIANTNGGLPPGAATFQRESGIGVSQWYGRFWARWSDALVEAGYAPNSLQRRYSDEELLAQVVRACRHFGKLPTHGEFRLAKTVLPGFPSHKPFDTRFRTRAALVRSLRAWAIDKSDLQDVVRMLPLDAVPPSAKQATRDRRLGSVYLIRSCGFFKIGRSDELERRVKEIRVALPEAAVLEHVITTDDPPGIEAYWHRRFADRKAKGEWFKLEAQDIRAFKRRSFQ